MQVWRIVLTLTVTAIVCITVFLVYVNTFSNLGFDFGPFLPNGERLRYIENMTFIEGTDSDIVSATIKNDSNLTLSITGGYLQVLEGSVERNLTTLLQVLTVPANASERVSFTLSSDTLVRGDYYLVALNTTYVNSQDSALLKCYRTYEVH